MYIPIEKFKVKVMFDTGATRTLMSRRIHKALSDNGVNLPLEPTTLALEGVLGKKLQVDGRIQFTFTFGPIVIKHPVIIVADMRDTLLIGNDLMDNRITIHEGKEITIKEEGQELTLPLCRSLPGIRLMPKQSEDIAPRTAKLIICKCGISPGEKHSRIVLVTGVSQGGIRIPELVLQIADDDTINVIIENETDDVLVVDEDDEIGEILPLRQAVIEGKKVYEPISDPDVVNFLHDRKLRDDVLMGTEKGVLLPIPSGYDQEEPREQRRIDLTTVRTPGLDLAQRVRLIQILERFRGVFSTGSGDYGKTPLMSFTIETGDAPPYAAHYYPIPVAYKSKVNQQMKQMQTDGVIEDANSPWSSNLVIVKKPNGKLQICANLKGVNALTKRTTSFPINFKEESLAKLCNGKYFFRIDLSQAYYSIPIDDPEHRDKTAFYTSGGQKRFRVSPFGTKYLPSQFNYLMSKILQDVDDHLFYYFDDIIGAYATVEKLMEGLAEVLFRLLRANLLVNFEKSDFILTQLSEIKWLGSVIQGNRVRPDQHKVEAITAMPPPRNRKAMQRFIGAMSYHRCHIPHFAEITAPLTKLFRKDVPYVLQDHELRAVKYLKAKLIEAPALELPDLNGHFIVTTDASDTAVGGCLSQPGPDGQPEQVITYCSRMLSPSERNGSSCAKELNAILYGIGHFYFYLANKHFTLRTEGLIYLRSFTKPNAKLHTASAILDKLSFDIEHQSATSKNLMGVADMIS